MEENKNIFTAKTVEDALQEGLTEMGLTLDEAEYEILETGKSGFLGLGAVKAKIKIIPKRSDAKRAAEFIDGLLAILDIKAVSEIISEEDNIEIDIKTTSSARVIGKHGDVLDAIQCLAGAVANIGREDYKKVVVDCENYRSQREKTLRELAQKIANTATETGRKMLLEPMAPYERRIIHSELMNNPDVKTASEGKEPARYIVVIPNNAKPYDKGVRFGDKRRDGGRRGSDRNRNDRERGGRNGRGERGGKNFDRRGPKPAGGAKRGKKEIYFGTYLGNSQKDGGADTAEVKTEEKE